MTTEIIPDHVFRLILTILTGGISVWLLFYDIYNMTIVVTPGPK